MAAKDLITLARAKQNIQAVTDTSQDALLTTLVTAVSDAVEKYCRRSFYSRSLDELYSGTGDRRLLLREYPIQSVKSVRYQPATVLKISNSNTSQNQQARVQVTSTGLTLTRVASGVVSTDASVTWAANPTLQGVANAVNALGNGWSASVIGDTAGDYGLWPSADLHVPPSYGDGTTSQGALTARGQYAELKLHTYELTGYQFDPRGWLLRAIPYTDPTLLCPEELIWPIGVNNFRIQYTAGYTTIPEAVQEAAAEWVCQLWYQTQHDPAQHAVAAGGAFSQTYESIPCPGSPPQRVQVLLAPYRRYIVATNQG